MISSKGMSSAPLTASPCALRMVRPMTGTDRGNWKVWPV